MAVLVEGISVIVRRSKINELYPGGWDGFVAACPNRTLCADADVARVGFMTPVDVEAFARHLEGNGLVFQRQGSAVDLAVVDQQSGPTTPCDWIEVGKVYIEGNSVTACRLRGSEENVLVTPDGWHYGGSLSATCGWASDVSSEKGLEFRRHESGMAVLFSRLAGKEVYVGRTGTEPLVPAPGKKGHHEI